MLSSVSLIRHVNRIRADTKPGDTLLEISLEVGRQSISQHPVGPELCCHPVPIGSLVHKTFRSVVANCLQNPR